MRYRKQIHTLGPWRAYDNYVEIPGKPLIYIETDNPMLGDSSVDTALIAAAPDLLAALKALLLDIEEYQRINHLGGEQNHAQVIARAAIAKAEGR